MSTSGAVGLWEQVLKLLQDGQPGSSSISSSRTGTSNSSSRAGDGSVFAKMLLLRIKLEDLPPQPKAVWKRLVQQLKVCVAHAAWPTDRQVSGAYACFLLHTSSSSSSQQCAAEQVAVFLQPGSRTHVCCRCAGVC